MNPNRVTVRLDDDEIVAIRRIAAAIKTPHRKAPTLSEAIRAALQVAAASVAASGALPS